MSSANVSLYTCGDGIIKLTIQKGRRGYKVYMSEDEAQTLSNRLQSFAKGNINNELVLEEDS